METQEHELWSFQSALFFLFLLFIVSYFLYLGFNTLVNVNQIKSNWANHRCNPMIMPFASFFGFNSKENFDFCMGKIFSTHSQSSLGSITSMFSVFTGLLENIFNSVSSIRNVIATLGGGINVVFQEFTDRITNFFFKLRLSAIRIKSLFMKMYAILFSVMYMGMSGISGMSSFTNTFLFSFLDTFCFPGDTEIYVNDTVHNSTNYVPIKDIKIGDVLLPGKSRVTATFKFHARGQPMVKLGSTIVSTNHYVYYLGKPIKAEKHPAAVPIGIWDSDDYLYCLNTDNHKIPLKYMTFLDYDETSHADKATMNLIENRVNGTQVTRNYRFQEYGFGIDEKARIKTKLGVMAASDIQIGDEMKNGSYVVGIIHRQYREICQLGNGTWITPSTLYWSTLEQRWRRVGDTLPFFVETKALISFIVIPSCQMELEDGTVIRDYMEMCSPDSEIHYSTQLESWRQSGPSF